MEAMRRIRWTRALQAAIGFSMLLWTGDALASSAIVSAITSACAGKTLTVSVTDCALCHGSAFTTVNPSNMYWSDAQSRFYDSFCAASTPGTGTTADTGTGGGTTASTGTGGTTAGSVFDDEDDIDRRFSRPTRTARGGGDDGSDDMASAGDDAGDEMSGASATGGTRRDARGDAQSDNGRGTEHRKRSRHWRD